MSYFLNRSLYPGLEGRFILESIAPQVMNNLKEAAKSRGKYLNNYHMAGVSNLFFKGGRLDLIKILKGLGSSVPELKVNNENELYFEGIYIQIG